MEVGKVTFEVEVTGKPSRPKWDSHDYGLLALFLFLASAATLLGVALIGIAITYWYVTIWVLVGALLVAAVVAVLLRSHRFHSWLTED